MSVLECDPVDRLPLTELIFDFLRPGEPIPTFGAVMTEARDWAEWASLAERKAYCAACYESLSPADQRSFLRFAEGRAAA